MNIKVILADDHKVVLDGIKVIIHRSGKNIEVIGEAANGREVLQLAEKRPADVYVIDIAMPVLNGIETIDRLLQLQPQSKSLVLSMYNDKILVENALKSGARGYILKDSATDEIVRAISEVYKGRYFLSPDISGYVVQGFLFGDTNSVLDGNSSALTRRQREILKLICEGCTDKDIARLLNISPNTVHVHKNNIMEKIDIHTKAGLIRYGIRVGIIQIDPIKSETAMI